MRKFDILAFVLIAGTLYQVTETQQKPGTKGSLSNLDLHIFLKKGRVNSYRIESVTWG